MFDDIETFAVVLNHEEQYSIWPADRSLPAGWKPQGFTGGRQECLDHIEAVWTDMRPLSVRNRNAASTRRLVDGSIGERSSDLGGCVEPATDAAQARAGIREEAD